MANNSYRPMHSDDLHDQFVELNTKDLAVGDKLIHVNRQGGTWGGPVRTTEKEVTVTKVLASRLVVTDAQGRSYRVLVQNSKAYPRGNGKVSTDLEGASSGWRREAFLLYTPEDPFLIRNRVTDAARNLRHDADVKVRKATEAFSASRTVENAQAAIEALQAFVQVNKTED